MGPERIGRRLSGPMEGPVLRATAGWALLLVLGLPLSSLGAHGVWKARSLRDQGRKTQARVIRKWEEHGSAWRGRGQASARFLARRMEIRYLDDAGHPHLHVLTLTDVETVLWSSLAPGSEIAAVYAANHPGWAYVPGTRDGLRATDAGESRPLLWIGAGILALGAILAATGFSRRAKSL